MTETPERVVHKTLREAHSAAMRDTSYIQREKSPELGYAILTEQAAIASIRPALLKHGLLFYPISCHYDQIGEFVTSKGSRMFHAVGRRKFALEHVESGEKIEVEVFCEGADTADRACAKMATTSKKNALREVMLVECGNDESAVVGQRGAPNEYLFSRAVTKINCAKSIEECEKFLDGLLAKTADDGSPLWTEEQCEELAKVHDKHCAWLVGKGEMAAKKAASQAF